ncbi:FAD binding domain-containing protein [Streptomyces cavernae]|uniref:FAD binding domain-containing protein n=1 Tax=Streptomyces cavernae TaxID=2259034 RepID=UPI000FEB9D85|nr:xanthine dehydrogenase family protein subunit M [Streptomyces cavernae]
MILPPVRYVRPQSVAEAASLLAAIDGAAVLAGGQTMINALKLDLVQPTALVDVHRLEELRGIEVADDGSLVIGAATTYAEIAASPVVRHHQPSVADMAAGLVDRQVRNRGTIGGNCCLNDPTNNFPPLLTALGAWFHITSTAGWRSITADTLFAGSLATALRPGELLMSVRLKPLPEGTRIVHRHLQLAADSWALARVVVRLDVIDGRVEDARVVLGAVPGSPLRLATVEQALLGHPADTRLTDAALTAFDEADVETVGDAHASAAYRLEMTRVQLRRALDDAVERSVAA